MSIAGRPDRLTLSRFPACETGGCDPENWDMTHFSGNGIVSRKFSGHVPILLVLFAKKCYTVSPGGFYDVSRSITVAAADPALKLRSLPGP